jgi:hypothetical protein
MACAAADAVGGDQAPTQMEAAVSDNEGMETQPKAKDHVRTKHRRPFTGVRSALYIQSHWCDLILAGKKTWEIRGSACHLRGRFCIAESSTGMLIGEATLIDCKVVGTRGADGALRPAPDAPDDFLELPEHTSKHCIQDTSIIKYKKKVFAWVLSNVARYPDPVPCPHRDGCVTWQVLRPDEVLKVQAEVAKNDKQKKHCSASGDARLAK